LGFKVEGVGLKIEGVEGRGLMVWGLGFRA
jgi:hypothetical protein